MMKASSFEEFTAKLGEGPVLIGAQDRDETELKQFDIVEFNCEHWIILWRVSFQGYAAGNDEGEYIPFDQLHTTKRIANEYEDKERYQDRTVLFQWWKKDESKPPDGWISQSEINFFTQNDDEARELFEKWLAHKSIQVDYEVKIVSIGIRSE